MSVSPDEGDGAIETSGRAQLDLFWSDAVVVVAQTAPMVGNGVVDFARWECEIICLALIGCRVWVPDDCIFDSAYRITAYYRV